MAIWLVRAGKFGEHENKFLSENRIYLTWRNLNLNLSQYENRQVLSDALDIIYPNEKKNTIRSYTTQVWSFSHELKIGDWVVMPSKQSSTIHIGEIQGEYQFHEKAENPFFHSYKVDWFAKDIPRANFDQDLLYSFGAFLTICRIQRNNAEERIKAMASKKWKVQTISIAEKTQVQNDDSLGVNEFYNIEEISYDQIAKFISRKFVGHNLTVLIEAVLKAKGYTTYRSPEGADKGIDILAGMDALGFGNPKLCVQVKSGDNPVDRPTLDQLIGVMQNVKADFGLLVSWSGFKSTVVKELPNQFFRVRFWDQKDIIQETLNVYDNLNEEIKTELPLKKIHILALTEE
jgi:restriction system protein